MTIALSVKDLKKRFGATEIIRGLSFEVAEGERRAIIGPNGAGKSTLFHLITGLLSPDEGSIRLRGQEISGLGPHLISRLGLSRSFQVTTIFPKLSVFENLRLSVMSRHNMRFDLFSLVNRRSRLHAETDALMELVRLERRKHSLAGDLTYSEQRALEIGMSLGPGGDIILLDEPTAGMSLDETQYTVDLIRSVTQGKTLLIVEHDMGVVFSLADHISVVVYGQVVATGDPDSIKRNRDVQEAYLGKEAD